MVILFGSLAGRPFRDCWVAPAPACGCRPCWLADEARQGKSATPAPACGSHAECGDHAGVPGRDMVAQERLRAGPALGLAGGLSARRSQRGSFLARDTVSRAY